MALINCSECGREISDKAAACPGCGAPVGSGMPSGKESEQSHAVGRVKYNRDTDTFTGTMILMVKLAMQAVQALGWKLDTANEALGLVTFETGMSWGSFSGISCSLNIEQVSPNTFRVTGSGKQNVRGGQLVAFNIGGEAQGRARKAIEKMRQLAS
jgi:zinc-ribbon domain